MKINRVAIIIENSTEDNASVRMEVNPQPEEHEEIEDTPASLLGAVVWNALKDYMEDPAIKMH